MVKAALQAIILIMMGVIMLDNQGSRPDFWCGQGIKHENLMGQDLDR